MTRFHVSMEAVSFAKVMLDTDDLSAIRGASWGMLAAASGFAAALEGLLKGRASVLPRFAGASRAHVIVEPLAGVSLTAGEIEAAARGALSGKTAFPGPEDLKKVLPYLVFTTAVSEDEGAAHERLRAVRQYQIPGVDLPEHLTIGEAEKALEADARRAIGEKRRGDAAEGKRLLDQLQPCVKDRTRPIARLSWRSAGEGEGKKPVRDVPVSASFFARHEFGRTGRRPQFYRDQAGVDLDRRASLADSFEEIAFESQPENLPVTVRNKMAVLYMDGNAFGALRSHFPDQDTFASAMADKRKALLKGIVEFFLEGENAAWLQLSSPGKEFLERGGKRVTPVLRFETLTWGADESTLVFPGWAFPAVLARLEALLAEDECGWIVTPGGERLPLTYGIGVAIGHYKTPIRAMKRLAGNLAENAKKRGKEEEAGPVEQAEMKSYADYMILGGIDMPVRSLLEEREALYGVVGEEAQRHVFPVPLDGFGETLAAFERVRGIPGDKETGAPRARLADILQKARQGNEIGMYDPPLKEELDKLLANHEDGEGKSLKGALGMGWSAEAPLAPLLHLVTLWNYLGLMKPPSLDDKDGGAA